MVLTIEVNCTRRLKAGEHLPAVFYLFIYESTILPQDQEIIKKKKSWRVV
jgi:hypothetical protein